MSALSPEPRRRSPNLAAGHRGSPGRHCGIGAQGATYVRRNVGPDPRVATAGHDTRALQAYLGHRNIQHTVRYTELVPDRFEDFWR
jgi:hypothetical protein